MIDEDYYLVRHPSELRALLVDLLPA